MRVHLRRLAGRVLSAFSRAERLFAYRARYARPARAKPERSALEERVVPDAVPVRAEWIGDAEEGGPQAAIRFTRTAEWDTDCDGTSFAPTAGAADTWFATTFTSTGPRTVAARVTDGGTARIVTRDVTVEYPPPVLTGPDDFTATQGQTRTLGVTADTDLDIVSVVWQVSYYYGDYETDESLTELQPGA